MNSFENKDSTISLKELWGTFLVSMKRIILITATAFLLSVIYALNVTPIFKAELLMVPADSDKEGSLSQATRGLGGLASLAGISLGGGEPGTETYLAILESRSFQTSFLDDNDFLKEILVDDWDEKNSKWRPEDPPTLMDGYKELKTVFFIGLDNKSSLISLSFYSEDPVFASEFLNKIISRVNKHIREKTILESEQSIKFIEDEIKITNVTNMQNLLYGLIEEQTKSAMWANVREEYAFQVIDPAIIPEERDSPRRTLIVIIGTFFGGILGLAYALFRKQIEKLFS